MKRLKENVQQCSDELLQKIAPLTAPDPQKAREIEVAIANLIDAKIRLAMTNIPRPSPDTY